MASKKNRHELSKRILVLILFFIFLYLLIKDVNISDKKVLSVLSTSERDVLRDTASYQLDSKCDWNLSETSLSMRAKKFNSIYETGYWSKKESRSGRGSSLQGAFDWIHNLRGLFEKYNIQSMADIPCGDTYWQFAVKEINTLSDLYFGGDISLYAIQRNQLSYRSHGNKIFRLWDLVRCRIPTYTLKNSTHEIKGSFYHFLKC